eukprot:9082353-Pyramimonas_sp.AAC.1
MFCLSALKLRRETAAAPERPSKKCEDRGQSRQGEGTSACCCFYVCIAMIHARARLESLEKV